MPVIKLVSADYLNNTDNPYFNKTNLVSGTVSIDKKDGEDVYELNYNPNAKKQFVNLEKTDGVWTQLKNEGVYWLEKTEGDCNLNGITMEAEQLKVLTAEIHVHYQHGKPSTSTTYSDIVWPDNWQWVDENDKTKPTIPDEAYDATGAHVLCIVVRTVKGSTIANVSHVYQIPVSE